MSDSHRVISDQTPVTMCPPTWASGFKLGIDSSFTFKGVNIMPSGLQEAMGVSLVPPEIWLASPRGLRQHVQLAR